MTTCESAWGRTNALRVWVVCGRLVVWLFCVFCYCDRTKICATSGKFLLNIINDVAAKLGASERVISERHTASLICSSR
ncbi:50S Ribosomal protein L22p/L17e [Candidatus Hodgkinia cicadicola]|nr:50S Ribosomal protein L22p/L17e [Candidatus Hodgkinia cicadicola]